MCHNLTIFLHGLAHILYKFYQLLVTYLNKSNIMLKSKRSICFFADTKGSTKGLTTCDAAFCHYN